MSGRAPVNTRSTLSAFVLPFVAAGLVSCSDAGDGPPSQAPQRLVLYTSLPLERITAVAETYRASTGVVVDFLIDSEEVLIDKLARKAHVPSADVLLITGAGFLADAVENDVLRPIDSQVAKEALTSGLRDPDGYWFALGTRTEMIVWNGVPSGDRDFGGYAALGAERWRRKLCLQRSVSERSRTLVAMLIARHGEREAERIVRAWRANLATSVFDEQRDLLAAVDAGACAVAIASSEEIAAYLVREDDAAFSVYNPRLQEDGVMRNVTAAGVARHASDARAAQRFIEWLLTLEGQGALHADGWEFPVLDRLPVSAPLDSWRTHEPGAIDAVQAGFNYQDAVRLVERARYR